MIQISEELCDALILFLNQRFERDRFMREQMLFMGQLHAAKAKSTEDPWKDEPN